MKRIGTLVLALRDSHHGGICDGNGIGGGCGRQLVHRAAGQCVVAG